MIENKQLKTSDTLILEAPRRIEISSIFFCNVSDVFQDLYVYAYPAGGVASVGNLIISKQKIPPNNTLIWELSEHLNFENGDILSGYASSDDSITATVNFKERD